jgi:hypothetical protein
MTALSSYRKIIEAKGRRYFCVHRRASAAQHVVNAIIDEIDEEAFLYNEHLQSVLCHDGVLKVGKCAFNGCSSLQRVKMPGVKIGQDFHLFRPLESFFTS